MEFRLDPEQDLPLPSFELPEAELQARFDALQRKLVPLWSSIEKLSGDDQTIVVVPSLTVDYEIRGSVLQAYEERFLFLLLLLRQPRAHLVYVTSQAIHPSVIDYYLCLLPGVIASHARSRLHLVSPLDASARPLSLKLLQRPRLLRQIRALIANPDRAHMVPFNTTTLERDLALRLGIPMYGADPALGDYGTKSGCRTLFRETGVAYPIGFENLHSIDDVIDAVSEVRRSKPSLRQVMIKLNEGVSGDGNSVMELGDLDASSRQAVHERILSLETEADGVSAEQFLDKLTNVGGVVEERIAGEPLRSPSVQLRVTPLGKVELLSTHDQLLGGPTGQTYLGCKFPADQQYAAMISADAQRVGERLAQEGVLGRFAIDFVTARNGDTWNSYAIELNLRKGGTTHPFLTLQFLTDGSYCAEEALFTTASGHAKYFVASDHIESPRYRAFTPDELFDIAVRRGLHFDQTRETGVVFHMMTALGDRGRLGLTAVANSHAEAADYYERTLRVLDDEADAALHVEEDR